MKVNKFDIFIEESYLDSNFAPLYHEYIPKISKMLFFLYKVEGIRIANYKEWLRI